MRGARRQISPDQAPKPMTQVAVPINVTIAHRAVLRHTGPIPSSSITTSISAGGQNLTSTKRAYHGVFAVLLRSGSFVAILGSHTWVIGCHPGG